MEKRDLLFGVFLLGIILAVSLFVVAKPNTDNIREFVPAHAVEVSKGVFSLGIAEDVDGRVVEGFMIVHDGVVDNKRAHAKPGNVCGNNICEPGEKKSCPTDCTDGNGEDTEKSTCFSLFAKGARWKTTEPYVTSNATGASINLTLTETSLNTWDSEISSFNIFGTGSSGTTNVNVTNSLDGKNEVEFQNLGATSTIAVTIVWGIFSAPPPFNELVEWDAVFNSDYPFGTFDGTVEVMDYQNIATHEFGHALGLNHPEDTCTEETMYAFADFNETKKRTLNSGDITGVNKLY